MSNATFIIRPFNLIYLYICLINLYSAYFPQNQEQSTNLSVKSQGTVYIHTYSIILYMVSIYLPTLSIYTHTKPLLTSTILCSINICQCYLGIGKFTWIQIQCSFLSCALRIITANSLNYSQYEYNKSKYIGV